MKTALIKIATTSGIALLTGANSGNAIQFRGELRGVWALGTDFEHTYGVSQCGIEPGDTFTWSYVYESQDVNGLFSPREHGLRIIKSDPLFPFDPGTVLNFDSVPFAEGLIVSEGAVSGLVGPGDRFLWEYDFYNPETMRSEASHFSIGLNDFRGFGAGSLTWSSPTPAAVPEASTCVLFSLGLGFLWLKVAKKKR